MTVRTPTLALGLLLCLPAALAGCKSDSPDDGGGTTNTGFVSVEADKTSVVANGSNFVNITVTDSSGGPVTVTTTKGTFAGGGTNATIPGASGSLTLVTCDAAASNTCTGSAIVRAIHGSASDSVTISFGSLAAICPADCTADPACQGRVCAASGGASGTCTATTPSLCLVAPACTPSPVGATDETSCSDAVDNDCDGQTDCADPDCGNRQCQIGAPTFLCQNSACTDSTSGLALTLTPARTRLPANGAQTEVAVLVTSGSSAAESLTVALATTAGTVAPAVATTGPDGVARFTFTGPTGPAVATLTATLQIAPTVTAKGTITIPALGSLQIPATNPVQYAVFGAEGSGWQEAGYVSVVALDDKGLPYPDGLAMRFEHQTLGGSTFTGALAADAAGCTAAQGCVGFLGATTSGADDPDTVGIASAVLRSGRVAGTLATRATATVGGVTRSITLPSIAVVGAKASGANFTVVCDPRNVPALVETDCAISLVDAPFTCQALVKDRFSNVLGAARPVVFAAETAAVGQVTSTPAYDPGGSSAGLGVAVQTFQTLGAGLPFDVPPVAGEPSATHALDRCGSRQHNPRDGVVTVVAIVDGEESFFDANGNGRYDAGEPFIDQGEPFVDQDDSGAWEAGEWFLDVNGDGAYTAGDGAWSASTKIWTQTAVVYSGAPATVSTAGGVLGTRWAAAAAFADACTATPVPPDYALTAASSAGYEVVASDLNLNRLSAGTTYDVVATGGGVTASYAGEPAYPDELGMFVRYWPCDTAGSCAAQCRAAPANLPCRMVPSVGAFTCGVAAPVLLSGGAGAPAGRVEWSVSTPYDVFGGSREALAQTALLGTTAAACTPSAAAELSCSDGVDEDCDGAVDCLDSDCGNQSCQAGSPTFLCQNQACTDTTSGLAMTVVPTRPRLPADGAATTPVTVRVTSRGTAAPGLGVQLAASAGAVAPATAVTDAQGLATFTFTAPASTGVVTLTAGLITVPAVTATGTVTMPALGALQIPATSAVQYRVLGAAGSGFQESGYVSVLALDDAGQPYPDGLQVRFEHRALGGSSFVPPLTADTGACVAPACVGFAGQTASGTAAPDTGGVAKAWLSAGRVSGTLATTATATVAGVTRSVSLPTVAVVGAKASATNFSIVCGPRNVPALAETDCSISLVDAPYTCQALLKDRFSNVLGRETQVVFASETAAVGQVTSTPAYDPTAGATPDLGVAVQTFETMGAGLPFDVPPLAGEPSSVHALDHCGLRTHNPRDGVATVIAVADGEEGFFDANGNGRYDAGEPYVDQGEPYVDQDDSGTWNAGEWFLDVDGSGSYTAGDGAWTADAKVWTQTVVVYTGYPETVPSGANWLGTRFADAVVSSCTPTAAPTPYAVLAAQVGPPALPPTSRTYWVGASDLNLNRLSTGTTYEAAVGRGGIEASYSGLASYADGIGMFYRYWPCDTAGNCASQCRSTTNLPCRMTPSISDFSCGFGATVTVTGGQQPDAGLTSVDWKVTTPYQVYGTGKKLIGGATITGTNN